MYTPISPRNAPPAAPREPRATRHLIADRPRRPLTTRAPLGVVASDPTGRYQGTVVATFRNYAAALKWGSWDMEYVSPEGPYPYQHFYLISTARDGALLISVRDARRGVE